MFDSIALDRIDENTIQVSLNDDECFFVDVDDPKLAPLVAAICFIVASILQSDTLGDDYDL